MSDDVRPLNALTATQTAEVLGVLDWIKDYATVLAEQSNCPVLRDVNFAFREIAKTATHLIAKIEGKP